MNAGSLKSKPTLLVKESNTPCILWKLKCEQKDVRNNDRE